MGMKHLEQQIAGYEDVAAKLKASHEFAATESPAFDSLAADCLARVAVLKATQSMLSPAPAATTVSSAEKDAIVYMVVNLKVTDAKSAVTGSVQEIQAKAVEAVMSKTVAGATGGAVTEVPEGSGKVAMQVAKDNPELAKAAVAAAPKS